MGGPRVSRERHRTAGRQFPPHRSEDDGGVVRPGRLGRLPPSGGAHLPQLQGRRELHSRAKRISTTHGDVAGRASRRACWSKPTTAVRPRSKAIPIIRHSLGAATALAQASMLNLYDPDRSCEGASRAARNRPGTSSRRTSRRLPLGDGSGLRFLSESVVSPSLDGAAHRDAQEIPESQVGRIRSLPRTNEPRRRDAGVRRSRSRRRPSSTKPK